MGSYVSNLVHFVWSTASRRALIKEEWAGRLHAYLGGTLKNKNAVPLAINGVEDHVHVLASLPSTVTLAETANLMKANSSRWVHQNIPGHLRFRWQEGYSAFTVSKSLEQTVIDYIDRQREHHAKLDYKQELLALLKKHGVPFDEQYLGG